MTSRHELQVELKKMEADYQLKVQELSADKDTLGKEKSEREKENQDLQSEISQLKEKVQDKPSHLQEMMAFKGEVCQFCATKHNWPNIT